MVKLLESVEVKCAEGKTGKAMLDAIVAEFGGNILNEELISLQLCTTDCLGSPCNICIASVYENEKPEYKKQESYRL